jgi:hypothetical protein
VFKRDRDYSVKMQAALLTKELIQRTPPLSGKTIKKIVEARGFQLRNPETEVLGSRKIGERAILRDRKRIGRKTGLRGKALELEVAKRQKRVGQAKSGWIKGHVAAGGKRPSSGGWLGRHGDRYGDGVVRVTGGKVEFNAGNSSEWAALGEAPRIVRQSIARRERAMANQIKRALEKQWGRGAGSFIR